LIYDYREVGRVRDYFTTPSRAVADSFAGVQKTGRN
jgi:hypothetical protein